jgi:prepilin-type processing-associated H-X9-DG protein
MIRILLGMLVVTWAMAPLAGAQTPASELGRIPSKALGVVHLRVGALYKGEAFRGLREFLALAGPEAMRTLQERFQITPLQIDRATLVVLPPSMEQENSANGIPFPFAIMVSTLVDIPSEKLPERLGIGQLKKLDGPFPFWEEEQTRNSIALPGPRLAILGSRSAVTALCNAKDGAAPEPFATLANHDLGVLVQMKMVPAEMVAAIPPPFSDLIKFDTLRMNMDLGKDMVMGAVAQYASEKEAQVSEEILKGLANRAIGELEKSRQEMLKNLEQPGQNRPAVFSQMPEALAAFYGLATMNDYISQLKSPPLKRNGNKIEGEIRQELNGQLATVSTVAIGVGLLLPAVQKVRQAANRTQGANNLKQIGLAFHNYESAYGQFPGNITDKKTGKALLSWRVAILPFIEQNNLYQQFKLDEPWDSEHNLKIAKVGIKMYAHSGKELQRDREGNCLTPYQGLAGPSGLLEPGKKIRFADIIDGTSNTILVVEAQKEVIWTKPEDVPFDPKVGFPNPEKVFGGQTPNGFNSLFADGSVRFISNKIDQKILKALFTRNGGENLGNGF